MSAPKSRCRRTSSTRAICGRRVFILAAMLALSTLRIGASDEVHVTPRTHPSQTRGTTPPASIRLDVKAVLVPVTVTDERERPVENLKKEDFQLFEDGAKQEIASFSLDDTPASIGVIFDASSSMTKKINASVAAVDQFFKTSLPGDEFLLVRFNDRPDYVTGFTTDIGDISAWLHSTRPTGWTALNDAIYMGIQKMKPARNSRKVLLVLSDGGDNNSRYSKNELRALVREADVQVYSISFFQGSRLLETVSGETGGKLFQVHSLSELPDAIEKLSREIRSQYVLSYYSNNPQDDGKYHRVRVDIANPTLRVSWKRGYYSPTY